MFMKMEPQQHFLFVCFFTLTIKPVFLHDMCKVSSWSKEAVIPYPVSTS